MMISPNQNDGSSINALVKCTGWNKYNSCNSDWSVDGTWQWHEIMYTLSLSDCHAAARDTHPVSCRIITEETHLYQIHENVSVKKPTITRTKGLLPKTHTHTIHPIRLELNRILTCYRISSQTKKFQFGTGLAKIGNFE